MGKRTPATVTLAPLPGGRRERNPLSTCKEGEWNSGFEAGLIHIGQGKKGGLTSCRRKQKRQTLCRLIPLELFKKRREEEVFDFPQKERKKSLRSLNRGMVGQSIGTQKEEKKERGNFPFLRAPSLPGRFLV